jgi:hypothetical protein
MFGTARSNQTATDSYLTEMLRAMLEIIIGVPRVYITQVRIKYEKEVDFAREKHPEWDWRAEGGASHTREAVINAQVVYPLTDVSFHSYTVKAEVDLVRFTYSAWKLLRTFVYINNYMDDRRFDFFFSGIRWHHQIIREANIPNADPAEATAMLEDLHDILWTSIVTAKHNEEK